jgi:hypothetical protein
MQVGEFEWSCVVDCLTTVPYKIAQHARTRDLSNQLGTVVTASYAATVNSMI